MSEGSTWIFEIGNALMKKQGTRNPEGYLKRRIGMAIDSITVL